MSVHGRAAARLLAAGFCWLTALYAFVASSAFAYLQFVRPRVFPWVGQFSDWHAAASLVCLLLFIALLWPDVRGTAAIQSAGRDASGKKDGVGGSARLLAISLLLACAAVCAWNVLNPILPRLTAESRSVVVGVLALVPLAWLAVIDLVRGAPYLRWQKPPHEEVELRAFEGRLFVTAMVTALFVTVLFAALSSMALSGEFEPDLLLPGLARGVGASLGAHLTLLAAAFLVVDLIVRATTRSFHLQYLLISSVVVGLLAVVFDRLVGNSLSLRGAPAAVAALAIAVSVAGTWTGLRLRRLEFEGAQLDSALDLYFGSSLISGARSLSRTYLLRLLAVGLLADAFVVISARADWDFVVLYGGVLVVWLISFAIIYRATPFYRNVSTWTITAGCLAPLVAVAATSANDAWRQPLGRYAVYNPSFRMADGLLQAKISANSTFDQYLRAHTGLTDVEVKPANIDFVSDLLPAAGPKPPMFLFVIDSLRQDYVAPYNPSVRFTPRIAQFAADSVVLRNAFTAFGGTGLSVPAIWAGASIVHKQYVQPFHPMNALEKLLDANGYRRFIGLDSIIVQLVEPSAEIVELDRGRNVMDYEFCRTLDELEKKLETVERSMPVFGYSLPQDIHMSKLPRTVDSGDDMRSFYPPYVTKVRVLDACFGAFIDGLRRLDLYEESLIVLTADHGEMLGEDGRFGHSYHLFPQIVQVPLIVHFPASVSRGAIDEEAVSLTTDITPTLYAALGYRPVRANRLMGRALGAEDHSRRRDTYVIPSSYGAVYASLRHNGRRLYIADGIRGGDQAFERDESGRWSPVEISEGLRAVNQLAIRQHIDEITRMYHLDVSE